MADEYAKQRAEFRKNADYWFWRTVQFLMYVVAILTAIFVISLIIPYAIAVYFEYFLNIFIVAVLIALIWSVAQNPSNRGKS